MIIALEKALDRYEHLDSDPRLDITIHTDSKYVHGIMTEWMYKWANNGWQNSRGQDVANQDLMIEV